MDDLAAFYSARLDEDEAAARAALPGPWMTGRARDHLVDNVVYGQSRDWPGHIVQVCNVDYGHNKVADSDHIARHGPDRVLREVEAGRALLDRLDRAVRYRDQVFAQEPPRSISDEMRAVTTMMTLEAVVKLHAAVYSDHPDYGRASATSPG